MELSHKHILVAIEIDITRQGGLSYPKLLNRSDAEQLLAHLSADLASMFPEISHCALTSAGALFDQTQVLQPGFPMFDTLESLLMSSFQGGGFTPRLLSFGSDDGVMPSPQLQPATDIPLGILQLLPIVVSGPHDHIQALGQEMEHRFLDSGQLSPHSAQWLESAFGIAGQHTRFMTITDLSAMFRLQLEHFGFLPLWEILDAAINHHVEDLTVETEHGNRFEWRNQGVYAPFQTFDYWASEGSGKHLSSYKQLLVQAYSEWTREQRQYCMTLLAHGVSVQLYLPDNLEHPLDGSFFIQEIPISANQQYAAITEHSAGDLGIVAITVIDGDRQLNFYPLKPSGLNDIHKIIQGSDYNHASTSFPGAICYDEKARCLKPDIINQSVFQ